jgi:hypothetical protein
VKGLSITVTTGRTGVGCGPPPAYPAPASDYDRIVKNRTDKTGIPEYRYFLKRFLLEG